MPKEKSLSDLSNAETLERFLAFLEVDIASDDKELFISNLLNSKKDARTFTYSFKFTKHEIDDFIRSEYQDIWQKQHTETAEVISKFDFAKKIKRHQAYKQHLAELKQNIPDAQIALHEALLTHRFKQYKNLVNIDETTRKLIFYKSIQAHYQQQFKALNNLFECLQSIEGNNFLESPLPLTREHIDYRRFLNEQSQHEIEATDHRDNFYRINGNDLGQANTVEIRSLQM